MPNKFCCCLSLNAGANFVGVIQYLGVIFAAAIAWLEYSGHMDKQYGYGPAIVVAIMYVVPAITYTVTLCSRSQTSKYLYTYCYFLFHFVVEAFLFIVPIIYLHSQWNSNSDQPQPILRVTVNGQVDNNGDSGSHQVTAREYLIANSAVWFFSMCVTTYVACCLNSNSKKQHLEDGMTADQRQRLIEINGIYRPYNGQPNT